MINPPLSNMEESDVLALLDNSVQESAILEYKSALPGNKDSDKVKFLAEITAFANSRGGLLLIGISDASGAPDEICGIETKDIDSEILRLEQIIQGGTSPRVKVEIMPLTVSGKTVLAIEIPKSWSGPHMVTANDHSKFYGRNSAGKYPMDTDELRHAFLSAESIPEQIRRFRTERVRRIKDRHELPVEIYDGPTLIIHYVPLAAFGAGGSCLISDVSANWTAIGPPGANGYNYRLNLDGVVVFSGPVGGSTTSYVQMFRNGIVEITASIGAEVDNKLLIAGSNIDRYIVESLPKYLGLMMKESIPAPYYCLVSLVEVLGAEMSVDRWALNVNGPLRSDRNTIQVPEVVIEEDTEDKTAAILPAIDMVWNAFGLSRSPNFQRN